MALDVGGMSWRWTTLLGAAMASAGSSADVSQSSSNCPPVKCRRWRSVSRIRVRMQKTAAVLSLYIKRRNRRLKPKPGVLDQFAVRETVEGPHSKDADECTSVPIR